MTIYVCSFGSAGYEHSLDVLRHTALTIGGADRVIVYTEDDLEPLKRRLPEFAGQKRGYMLWAWKPYVILQTMTKFATGPNDVVVYCDACTTFTGPIAPHLDLLREDPIVLFRLGEYKKHGYLNKFWTKRDCFLAMDCDEPAFHDCYQLNAAVQMYRASPEALTFLESYQAFCWNVRAMDDIYRAPNLPGFRDHRHDQSVLTNLHVIHAADICVVRDPTQFGADDVCPSKKALPPFLDHHRQKLEPMVRTAVITPTIGTPDLARCVASVQAQLLAGVTHYIVVDGKQHADAVIRQLQAFAHKKPVQVLVLPENTGADGWNGHRVYGALPFLVNAHFVAFLDEDNWYAPDHLLGLMTEVREHDLDWTFSLRTIVDGTGREVVRDNCESLGNMCHTAIAPGDFLVDTSCMLLKTRAAVEAGPSWYHQSRDADRSCTAFLLDRFPRTRGVPRHTLYYAAKGGGSVAPDFFVRGNDILGYDFAAKPTIYIFHFNEEATRAFLRTRRATDRSHALDEWQRTLLRDVAARYNLVDGYAMGAKKIPTGATVYVSMCLPHQLPLEVLQRTDLKRIGYTLESPNIVHQDQWRRAFLDASFDRILTYWTPLLEALPSKTIFCPHNTHHLDFSNPLDVALLADGAEVAARAAARSVCMVLERRDRRGTYEIDGVRLQCLDTLREHYVRDLDAVTVYGVGWDAFVAARPNTTNVRVGHALHRSRDPSFTVDILKKHTFVIIIENTDADGYVSEKIYDAFIAGTIPIYYGNNNKRVNIPRDMYIDLKKFSSSRALNEYLAGLTTETIREMQDRILRGRRAVLERVSTRAFAECLEKATRLA